MYQQFGVSQVGAPVSTTRGCEGSVSSQMSVSLSNVSAASQMAQRFTVGASNTKATTLRMFAFVAS